MKSEPDWPAISVSTSQQSHVGQIVWFGCLSAISQLASREGEWGNSLSIALHSLTLPGPGGESREGSCIPSPWYQHTLLTGYYHIYARNRKKSTGQAHLSIIWTGAMDGTSGQALFIAQFFFKKNLLDPCLLSKPNEGTNQERTPFICTPQVPRALIFKRLWRQGIDSKEWIPPAYVAWRAGTMTLFLLGS
jgi:hypothetical protein